jgi:uncharacterized protein (DUF1697 family)
MPSFDSGRATMKHKPQRTVVISMLRGINLAKHHRIKMEDLRACYQSLHLLDPRTYVQSGNVVFATGDQDLIRLARRIEQEIEATFGFRSDVILRTPAELREVVAKNPFANRRDIEPSRLLVTFLPVDPGPEIRDAVLKLEAHPEELRMRGRELYTYYPNGMARPTLSSAAIERTLKTRGTGRNWNSILKVLAMAEEMEASLRS